MVLDELSRFPNLYRFGPMAIARRLGESICDYWYHRTLSSHSPRC
jgi:hypothetical protein